MVKKIAKSGMAFLSGILIARIFGYLFKLLVARTSANVYGLYNLGLSIIMLIIPFAILGLNNGVNRFVSYYRAKKNENEAKQVFSSALKVALPLSIFYAILVFVFSGRIASFFNSQKLSIVLKLLSILIPILTVKRLFISLTKGLKKIKQLVISQHIAISTIKLLLTLFSIYIGFILFGIIISVVIANILGLFLLINFSRKFFQFKIKKGIKKEVLLYSAPLIVVFVFYRLVSHIDSVMLGFFTNPLKVGIYNTAFPTAELFFMVPMALLIIFLPTITEKLTKKKEIKQDYKSVSRWIFFINLPFLIFTLVFSQDIITVIFGSQYTISSLSLKILSVGFFINGLLRPGSKILLSLKKTKLLSKFFLFSFGLDLILNYLLIPPFGIEGAAIATSVTFFVIGAFNFIFSYRFMKISIFDLNYIKAVVSGIISIFLVFLLSLFIGELTLIPLVSISLIFLVFYNIFLFLFKSLTKKDKEILFAFLNKFKILFSNKN